MVYHLFYEVVNVNKKEWQSYHQITDQEMHFITQIIKETNGNIVSIIITQRDSQGNRVPFNERK